MNVNFKMYNHHHHGTSITNGGRVIPVSSVSSFYELSSPLLSGKMEQFSKYDGRVTLVVNIATCDRKCKQELLQLNELVSNYASRGLTVMCFPCNQFGRLEPLDNDEILLFLQNVRPAGKFEPKFSIYSKCEVNGCHSHPVFEFLRVKQPFPLDDDGRIARDKGEIGWYPITRYDISWNFEKFLIGYDGQPAKRYSYKTPIDVIKRDIESLMRRIPKSVRELLQLQQTHVSHS